MEFDGLVAAGTFAEVTEIPDGCNIVDAKWLYKWIHLASTILHPSGVTRMVW